MRPRIIGIAGASGAGKSTVAHKLNEHFGPDDSIIISTDNYYKDQSHIDVAKRANTNYDHPDSIDFALLAEHLKALENGKEIDMPEYDFKEHNRQASTKRIKPKRYIIVEGILALHASALAKHLQLKIFVKSDLDSALLHRIDRDTKERGRTVQQVITQYTATVLPMRQEFVEPSKNHADLVVLNNTHGTGFNMKPVTDYVKAWFNPVVEPVEKSVDDLCHSWFDLNNSHDNTPGMIDLLTSWIDAKKDEQASSNLSPISSSTMFNSNRRRDGHDKIKLELEPDVKAYQIHASYF